MQKDCSFASLKEAIQGTTASKDIVRDLVLMNIGYLSFQRKLREGQLVVHRDLVPSVKRIFPELIRLGFPIGMIVPISVFGWSDARSMAANNCSAFANPRLIPGTDRFSWHSYGRAIDLCPVQNPFTKAGQDNEPKGAVYDPSVPGTLLRDGPVVRLFLDEGYKWGGNWTDPIDYHHFEMHWV